MYDAYRKYGSREARDYDSARETEALWHEENRFVEQRFAPLQLGRVLDAPVGTGRFLQYYRAAEIVGVDISDEMLAEARRRCEAAALRNVQLQTGDIFHLPFADRHFDAVVSWRFLHLLPRELLVPALAELRRVAAGEVLVQIYVGAPWPRRAWQSALRRLRRLATRVRGAPAEPAAPWAHIRAHHHSAATFDAAIAAAGLAVSSRVPLRVDAGAWALVLHRAGIAGR